MHFIFVVRCGILRERIERFMSTELMAPGKNKNYASNDHGPKSTNNRCNGCIIKTIKSAYGDIPVEVPCYRKLPFDE